MSQKVDKSGRIIPTPQERVYAVTDRKYFCLQQPDLDLSSIFERYYKLFKGAALAGFDLSDFKQQVEILCERISRDSTVADLLNGVYVPFILPQKKLLGERPISYLVKAAGESFQNVYPQFEFKLLSERDLDVDLEIKDGSRWETVETQWVKRTLVGLYFPTAMSGYAIPDHTVALSRLADNLVLSGIPDVASSIIGSPSLLMKNDGKYPNLLALGAFAEKDEAHRHMFHFFEAYGWNLYFNRRSQIGAVSEYYSGGISYINNS